MDKIVNIIIILAIFGGIGALIAFYFRKAKYYEDDEEVTVENIYEIDHIVREIARTFNAILKTNVKEQNMSREMVKEFNAKRSKIRKILKTSAYGDSDSKRKTMALIKDIVGSDEKMQINKHTVDKIIPFKDNVESISGNDKFLIISMIYLREFGPDGIPKWMDDYGLSKKDEITAEDLNRVYEDTLMEYPLTYADKMDILAQRFFEQYKGFGVADILFESSIDEVEGGVSGVPKDGIAASVSNTDRNITYSYQSIWIILHGRKIHLSCLDFGSQAELVRVCNNIYKYKPPKALSRDAGYVLSTMYSGSRVVVMRPDFADSYAFLVRKFDSAKSIEPEKLLASKKNNEIVILMLKWLIRGQRNLIISGEQGCGKSTFLKSMIRFIPKGLSLRIQELAFELSLRFAYPDRNILSFQETGSVSAQQGLNIQKKTSGDVNIIGEISEAVQAAHYVQTAKVASLFAWATHHAKTVRDMMEALGNNLMQEGLYSNMDDAIRMVCKTVNIDIHLVNIKGDRHVERITEIIPLNDPRYPSDINGNFNLDLDTKEYYKRQTDRKLYTEQNLIVCDGDSYKLVSLPSEDMMQEIRNKLTIEEEAEFERDMKKIKDSIA